MTLTCDHCGRQFLTSGEPVPGRVFRVPCRCGANLVFELEPARRAPPALPPAARWTPPAPLPPAARARPRLQALACDGAAAPGSDSPWAAAAVPAWLAPGWLGAWAAALPEPDQVADAPAKPSVRPDTGGLAGLEPDPDEGLEHSILAWISAETARDRAFATGFATGTGASVLVVAAAVWLCTVAARAPSVATDASLAALQVARAAPAP